MIVIFTDDLGYADVGSLCTWGTSPSFCPPHRVSIAILAFPTAMICRRTVPVSGEVKFNEGYTREDYLSFQGDSMSKENYRRWVPNVPLMKDTLVVEWPVDQSTLTQRYTSEAISFPVFVIGTPGLLVRGI